MAQIISYRVDLDLLHFTECQLLSVHTIMKGRGEVGGARPFPFAIFTIM
jgi:hypothetical protein